MCDEKKSAYCANWITIINNKSTIAGVNSEPLYLSQNEALPLLLLGAIIKCNPVNS